ncbi:MAG: hypothetical protein IV100_03175 [Myxococcales bacterium]|nr:hypothetical protein [Myxococcales bacterium]
MSLLTLQLRDDTDGFIAALGHRPFYISDAAFTPAVKSVGDQTHERLKIMGRDRIAFANIVNEPRVGGLESQILGAGAGQALPCYWLPWKKDSAIQIKLKPSGKGVINALPNHLIATRGANDSTSLVLNNGGNWVDRGIVDENPDLFFTGMMNGCSLFVSGPSDSPTAYHVNRASYMGDRTQELLSSNRDRDNDINKLKSDKMVRDFKHFDKPSLLRKTAQVTPASQHRRNPLGNRAQDNAKQERSQLIRRLVGGNPNQAYRIRAHWVSAFGVRRADTWRFYKQDIYQYSQMDDNGNAIANTEGIAASRAVKFY